MAAASQNYSTSRILTFETAFMYRGGNMTMIAKVLAEKRDRAPLELMQNQPFLR